MKLLMMLGLLLLITIRSFAQENSEKLQYLSKVEKYRKMKNAGATLTVLGGVLVVVGLVTMSNSTYDLWTGDETGNFEAGAAAYLVGAAGLGSGIPLWIVGAHNQRKYKSKFESLSVRINASPHSNGLTLSYRF